MNNIKKVLPKKVYRTMHESSGAVITSRYFSGEFSSGWMPHKSDMLYLLIVYHRGQAHYTADNIHSPVLVEGPKKFLGHNWSLFHLRLNIGE